MSALKSESCELLNLWQNSLGWCDRVMRADWNRNFWPFTLVESLGYLCEKLVVHGKYHPFILEELNHQSLTEMCIRYDQGSRES